MSTKRLDWHIKFSVVLLALLTWVVLNLPVPALPGLANYFHVSYHAMKWTLSAALLAFALVQIPWGAFSDRFGRRLTMLVSISIGVIGLISALFSTDYIWYLVSMIVVGLSFGSAPVLSRAPLADRFEKHDIVKTYAWVAIASIVAPFIAYFIGSNLEHLYNFRIVFAAGAVATIGYLLFSLRYYHETNDKPIKKFDIRYIYTSVLELMKMKVVWRYAIIYALMGGFMIAFYASLTYWYLYRFHLSPLHISWMALPSIVFYILGSNITNMLIKRIDSEKILRASILFMLALGLVLVILSFAIVPTAFGVTTIMVLVALAAGAIIPLTNAALVHRLRSYIGVLPGLMSGLRCLISAILVPITAGLMFHSYWALCVLILGIAVIGGGSYFYLGVPLTEKPVVNRMRVVQRSK